jgi:hypothetical protein
MMLAHRISWMLARGPIPDASTFANGRCHRRAPVVIDEGAASGGGRFPHMKAHGWCGDYAPLETYVMFEGEDGLEPRP